MNLAEQIRLLQRRTFLKQTGVSLGSVALCSLLDPGLLRGAPQTGKVEVPRWTGVVHPLHSTQRVKRVIFLTMAGGPSHLETFDHKPKLAEMSGKPMPESFTKGQPISQLQGAKLNCLAP